MSSKTIIAVILIVLGIVVLGYSGITYQTRGESVNFLGMHLETMHSHYIPPAVGAIALIGGIELLAVNSKKEISY